MSATGRGAPAKSATADREIVISRVISAPRELVFEAFTEVRDATLVWYIGLDAEGTRIGDALWNGEDLDETAHGRVVGLYRLTFRDPSLALDKVGGEPIYLIAAMGADMVLRLKPQNLVTGLPVTHLEMIG